MNQRLKIALLGTLLFMEDAQEQINKLLEKWPEDYEPDRRRWLSELESDLDSRITEIDELSKKEVTNA